MSRVDDIFAAARPDGRTLLMPFVTAGYPSLAATRRVLPALEEAGADLVEIGFPFSDPIADGPVIAASMHEALRRGTTPIDVLDLVRELRPRLSIGLVAMVSDSIVERMGAERFVDRAAEAGFDGLIVPDVEASADEDGEAARLSRRCADRDLAFAMLIGPFTPLDRVRRIVRRCRGFVYVLARAGLTGERDAAPAVAERVKAIREETDLPLAVGFGIATAEHVRIVGEVADAAIVGSALVRRMGEADDPVEAARAFVRELRGRDGRPTRYP